MLNFRDGVGWRRFARLVIMAYHCFWKKWSFLVRFAGAWNDWGCLCLFVCFLLEGTCWSLVRV